MLEQYQMNKESIISKQNYLRIESQIMMTRIQKFTSHMLIDAQREMHKNNDNHYKRFKKQIDEFETLIEHGEYWQIIYNKNELKSLKR